MVGGAARDQRAERATHTSRAEEQGKGDLIAEPGENRNPEGSDLTGCRLSEDGKEQEPRREDISKQAVSALTLWPLNPPRSLLSGSMRAAPGLQNRDGERSQRI